MISVPGTIELHPKVKVGLAVWCAVVFFGVATFGFIQASQNAAAAHREHVVDGEVIEPGPWNHGPTYRYRYVFQGRSYSGPSMSDTVDRAYASGETISVYLDPLHPERSALIDFHDRIDWSFAFGLLGASGLALAYAIFEARRLKVTVPVFESKPPAT